MELCLGFAVVTVLLVDGPALHVAVRTNPWVLRPFYAAFEVFEGRLGVSHRTPRLASALVAVGEPRLNLNGSCEVVDSTCEACRCRCTAHGSTPNAPIAKFRKRQCWCSIGTCTRRVERGSTLQLSVFRHHRARRASC